MPKKIGTVDRSVLTRAALPQATATYTVITHAYVINTIMQALDENGFTVKKEVYRCTADAKVAHGSFIINYDEDPELELMYSFSNSYDKSLRFRAAVGAYVPANDGFIISEMDNWKRKHTGTADHETDTLINEHIAHAKEYFAELIQDKDAMKEITINKATFGSIIGELFINGYLGIDQMSAVAKEYNAKAIGLQTVWTCYCFIISALRQAHPSKWMQSQVATHLFLTTKYNIGNFDEDESAEENIHIDTFTSQEPIHAPVVVEADTSEFIAGESFLPGFNTAGPVITEEAPVADIAPETFVDAHFDPIEVPAEETPEMEEAWDINSPEWKNGTTAEPEEEIAVMVDPALVEAEEHIEEPIVEAEKSLEAQGADIIEAYALKEAVQEKVAEEESENSFIFQDDYPGLSIGDALEIEGEYFEIIAHQASEDGDLWECKEVSIQEEETEGDSVPDILLKDEEEVKAEDGYVEHTAPAPAITPAEYKERIAEVTEGQAKLDEITQVDLDAEEDADWAKMGAVAVGPTTVVEENAEGEPLVSVTPVVVDFTEPEIMEPNPAVEEAESKAEAEALKNTPVYKAIAEELEDIYGFMPEFTYTEQGTQYNIVLASGESVVLSTSYIKSVL